MFLLNVFASNPVSPTYIANIAGISNTANGINHPKLLTSSNKANEIQYSPEIKKPKPNHQPNKKAFFLLMELDNKNKKQENVTNKIGNKNTGAKAKGDNKPRTSNKKY